MKSFKFKNLLLSVLLVTAPLLSHADTIFPALDVQLDTNAPHNDTGIAFVDGVSFDVDATSLAIVFDDGTPSIALPHTDFDLFSTYNGGTSLYEGSFTSGTLLSGVFTDLDITFHAPGLLPGMPDTYKFSATVTYTGGSLAAGLTGGGMTGDFLSDGSSYIAKIGEVTVVPVPAAVWLFASGLLGLVAVSRRKAA